MKNKSRTNRVANAIVILLGLLCVQGCTDPQLKPVPVDGVILAFGDSLTVGTGADPSKSYPSVLSELSGRHVVNAGVSGETTASGLQRLPEALAQTNPDLLILAEGGNDILRNHNPAQTKQNLAAMIELAQNQDVQVVLIGVPGKNLFLSAPSFYEDLAQTYQLVFDDRVIADLLHSPTHKSDPVHLNEKGYRVMAQAIYALLRDRGAF